MNRLSAASKKLLGDPALWVTTRSSRPGAPIVSPLDGIEVGTYPICESVDVELALTRARAAQSRWVEKEPAERAKILETFTALVWKYEKELLDLIQGENGKARSHAFEEISDVAMTASFYAKKGPGWLKPEKVPGVLPVLTRTRVNHHPRGVVAVIAPWTTPLTLAVIRWDCGSFGRQRRCPQARLEHGAVRARGKKLLEEAGLEADLFQVVPGPGPKLGAPLIEGSDYVMFTGSTKTGRNLAAQAGEKLVPFYPELGGKTR